MSNEELENGNELPQISELDSLKARADLLNIKYHPSIKVESLRAKVNAKLNDEPDPEDVAAAAVKAAEPEVESENARRLRKKREANKLRRVNVTCMNPAKKEWDGEIFTVGNLEVGTFRKFIPFNTTEGYHIPEIIFNMMKARECQIFVTKKTKMGNVREGKLIKEFAFEMLEDLTPTELEELARRQALASGQSA